LSIQVSVVVPTFKRPHLLRNCLNALINQQYPPHAYEILIVDDACSEETQALVEGFSGLAHARKTSSCPQIRYATAAQTHGPAAARNIGWCMARGEIIAFTDDDCLPEPDWLQEGMAALKDDLAGVSGQVIVPIPVNPTDYEKNVSRLANCEFVTANCFYRRSALEASGGFDEKFTMAWREDSDLQFKLLTLSYKLGRAPAARVIHPVRPAPWGVSIQEQRKSMFDALLFKKYPELYHRRIRSGPPLTYYGILISTVGFIAAILAGHNSLALSMIIIWAGLSLHFCFLRLKHTIYTPSHVLEMLVTSMVIPYLSIFWRLYGAFYFRVVFF
jgi:GT2 family glycosyltransferase